jgi:exosome complex exonuclease DIS3/RRP44
VLFTRESITFDAENHSITVNELTVSVFNKVRVSIQVETDRNTQRGKVKMGLLGLIGQ